MTSARGIRFDLSQVRFDDYGRALVLDRTTAEAMHALLGEADAIACQSGCGLPLACDSALIQRHELTQIGPELLINNADFAAIIRKRKAVDAKDVVIAFDSYRRIEPA